MNHADPALHNFAAELAARQHSAWDHFYTSGGYGMYPTTVFGFVFVLVACFYCFRPEKRFIPFVLTTGTLTLASGVLGTFTGLIMVFTYVQYVDPAEAARVAAVGASQSFANIVFGLVLVILGGVAVLGGVIRQALGRVA